MNVSHGNNPMIIKIRVPFSPENFDLDYELSVSYSVPIISAMWDIFKKIPDKQIVGMIDDLTEVFTVSGKYHYKDYSGEIYILPSKSTKQDFSQSVSRINLFFVTKDNYKSDMTIQTDERSTERSTVEDAAVLGSVCNFLEKNYPNEFKSIEQQQFNKIVKNNAKGAALKYDGEPIKINPKENIEVMAQGSWMDGQTYLDQQVKNSQQIGQQNKTTNTPSQTPIQQQNTSAESNFK